MFSCKARGNPLERWADPSGQGFPQALWRWTSAPGDTQSCFKDPKQCEKSLPLPCLGVSPSRGWMCQQHHLLKWKNRMSKKILSLSLILMDFNAVWHLRRKEEPKSSLSSGPDTHCKCTAVHPYPCPWHLDLVKPRHVIVLCFYSGLFICCLLCQ